MWRCSQPLGIDRDGDALEETRKVSINGSTKTVYKFGSNIHRTSDAIYDITIDFGNCGEIVHAYKFHISSFDTKPSRKECSHIGYNNKFNILEYTKNSHFILSDKLWSPTSLDIEILDMKNESQISKNTKVEFTRVLYKK